MIIPVLARSMLPLPPQPRRSSSSVATPVQPSVSMTAGWWRFPTRTTSRSTGRELRAAQKWCPTSSQPLALLPPELTWERPTITERSTSTVVTVDWTTLALPFKTSSALTWRRRRGTNTFPSLSPSLLPLAVVVTPFSSLTTSSTLMVAGTLSPSFTTSSCST